MCVTNLKKKIYAPHMGCSCAMLGLVDSIKKKNSNKIHIQNDRMVFCSLVPCFWEPIWTVQIKISKGTCCLSYKNPEKICEWLEKMYHHRIDRDRSYIQYIGSCPLSFENFCTILGIIFFIMGEGHEKLWTIISPIFY